MRILYYSHLFPPHIGGMETFGLHLLKDLQRRGHQIRVIASHESMSLPDFMISDGIPVYRLPLREAIDDRDPAGMHRVLRECVRLINEFRPDVCHLNHPSPSLLIAILALRQSRCSVVLSLHNQLRDELTTTTTETVMNHALRRVDWVTACADFVRGELLERAPEAAKRSSVIHYGCFEDEPLPEPFPAIPTILWAARIVEQKRLDLAIDAFGRIAERIPEARFIIGGDGPERAGWQTKAEQLGLASRIAFRGWLTAEQSRSAMTESTLVLMSSEWEGLPLVAIEAGICGRPLVGTRVGGLSEVVVDGETGRLTPFGDPVALADAAVEVLTNPQLAQRMGATARHRVERLFRVERMVDDFEQLFERVVTSGG